MNSSIIEQIQKGESKTLELKESLPGDDAMAKTVVAFSNTSEGRFNAWGNGLLRMRERCRVAGIPEPSIRETVNFVEVEFIRPQTIQTDDYGQIPLATVGKPSDTVGLFRTRKSRYRIPFRTSNHQVKTGSRTAQYKRK